MASIRTVVTLVLALTFGLAATAAAQPLSGPEFIGIEPCRLADTRPGFGFGGAYGPPALVGGAPRNFPIQGQCGIPATATAVAFNFTITQPAGAGWLTVWPAGGPFPPTSMVNYVANEDVANASDVLLGAGGAISVQSVAMTHLVIDVYGYFTDVEELPGQNTALGDGALAANLDPRPGGGFNNTAVGARALQSNTTGFSNTATGVIALSSNTMGYANTAIGAQALQSNTLGFFSTAVGSATLAKATSVGNTAVGAFALFNAISGGLNTAIGLTAGLNVTTGSNNIHIQNPGDAADTARIRIGTSGTHTSTFIAGIQGVTTGVNDAVAVLIDSAGQLGTANSSRRVKTDIHDLGDQSRALHQLRPVSFRYRSHPPDGPLEYGLIAEEVAEIYPELVVRDKDGQPAGVKYQVLPALLLNELQRQQREIAELRVKVQEIDELRAQVRALIGGRAAVKE
jgi:hypothetical protein